MRLINVRTFELEDFFDDRIPPYAILSHTWDDEEVSYRDMQDLSRARTKKGFRKMQFTCDEAGRHDLTHAWIDTCCIDKSSSADLQEAINSMFNWYCHARHCYAYLADVPGTFHRSAFVHPDKSNHEVEVFSRSRWFTRGWTLQELLAPRDVSFFGADWNYLGSKSDFNMRDRIADITKIVPAILGGQSSISSACVAVRMSWAAGRKTSREEDQAYSMLGLFGINMPMLYGEGENAFIRLQEEIIKSHCDHSVFAWGGLKMRRAFHPSRNRVLASCPDDFAEANSVVQWGRPSGFGLSNRGLRINLPLLSLPTLGKSPKHLAILNCRQSSNNGMTFALWIQDMNDGLWTTGQPRLVEVDMLQLLSVKTRDIEISHVFSFDHHRRGHSRGAQFRLRGVRAFKSFSPIENRWEEVGDSLALTLHDVDVSFFLQSPKGQDYLVLCERSASAQIRCKLADSEHGRIKTEPKDLSHAMICKQDVFPCSCVDRPSTDGTTYQIIRPRRLKRQTCSIIAPDTSEVLTVQMVKHIVQSETITIVDVGLSIANE